MVSNLALFFWQLFWLLFKKWVIFPNHLVTLLVISGKARIDATSEIHEKQK
jgi:hypothetical protein